MKKRVYFLYFVSLCLITIFIRLTPDFAQANNFDSIFRENNDIAGKTDKHLITAYANANTSERNAANPVSPAYQDYVNNIILGSPTATSVVLKSIAAAEQDAYFEYGKSAGNLYEKTVSSSYKKGTVMTTVLEKLTPDTKYYYRMLSRPSGSSAYIPVQTGTFHTQRRAGESFSFTIQADSHRDENSDLSLYSTTLDNVLKDQPDFHIDLGDTFMGEKFSATRETTLQRYLEDRAFFTRIAASIPLFLVNGNHEGENGWDMQKNSNNIGIWASNARLNYFPNPDTGDFYTGSTAGHGNYYAFTWGNGLFIMLDPFWFSQQKAQGNQDGWKYTLGKTQYEWLQTTLKNSTAKYKFVFIHNLVGGYGKDSRGGAEAAKLFEWGGYNYDGSYGFDKMRPGWGLPIHQLLVDNNVTAVFHGHDHFYAKQEKDGIVYQLVPQPSHPGRDIKNASEYSYKDGVFLPSSGHLRVTVSDTETKVEYIKSSQQESINGKIVDSYSLRE